MLKSPHAINIVAVLFVIFSLFVVYGALVGHSRSSSALTQGIASSQVATVAATAINPNHVYFQVLVVSGEASEYPYLLTNPPINDGYLYWIADKTLTPPPSSQALFSISRGSVVQTRGVVEGLMFDQATSTATAVTVRVPRLSGYEVVPYYYASPFGMDVNTINTTGFIATQPLVTSGSTVVGASLTEHYFTFPLTTNRQYIRLVIFYKKLPVACRYITVELLEEKMPPNTNYTRFSLANTPTTTARDLSHLVTPSISGSDFIPDFRMQATNISSAPLGTFDVSGSRFSIVDYESPDPENEGILESDVGLLRVVMPFNVGIRNVVVRSNWSPVGDTPFFGTHATIPLGPFPATCPAVCQLEFQSLDSSLGSDGCCAGLTPVEGENGLVCQKI